MPRSIVVRRLALLVVALGLVASGCAVDSHTVDVVDVDVTAADGAAAAAVGEDATSVHWVGAPVPLDRVASAAWSDPDWTAVVVTDPAVDVGSILLVHREGDRTVSVNQTTTTSSVDAFNWHPWLGQHVGDDAGREFVVVDGEVPGGTCAQWDVVQPWEVVERHGDLVEAQLDEVLVVRGECESPNG